MISRRALITRAALVAAGAGALFAVRDRLPWPPLDARFANGRDTPWQRLPDRPGLVEMTVAVNGAPVRAVIDSGAQLSAVDAGLAARLGLERVLAAPLLAYGVAGRPRLTHTVHMDLTTPGLAVPGLRAAVLDLAGMAAASGRDFQLLIGRDVLRRLVLEADFPLRRARFLAHGVFRPARDTVAIPLKVEGGAPLVGVQIEAAQPLDLLVDTGATGDLALSDGAGRRAGLTGAHRLLRQGHSISLGGLTPQRTVVAATVRLGPLSLRNIDVQIYAPGAARPGPGGLIGAGLLHPFRVALDLGGGKLWLTPAPLMIVRPEPSA